MEEREVLSSCPVCGEDIEEPAFQSEWLCLDCKDSWERDREMTW